MHLHPCLLLGIAYVSDKRTMMWHPLDSQRQFQTVGRDLKFTSGPSRLHPLLASCLCLQNLFASIFLVKYLAITVGSYEVACTVLAKAGALEAMYLAPIIGTQYAHPSLRLGETDIQPLGVNHQYRSMLNHIC